MEINLKEDNKNRHREKTYKSRGDLEGIFPPQPSAGTDPADTLTLGFWTPEL